MAKGERNRSKYAGGGDRRFIDLEDYTDAELEEAWYRAKKTDPLLGLYDRLKKLEVPSLKCEEVMAALEFLYAATAKECFQEAAAAMREMHLVEGGLKLKALDSIKNRTAAHRGAFTMHLWIVRHGLSPNRAAKLTVARYGLPGASFEAAVKDLKAAYEELSPAAKNVGKSS
jgi:hypothetical protein